MTDIPQAAITAAAEALRNEGTQGQLEALAAIALEAAAPLLAAVERERCAQFAEKTGAIIPFRMAADNSTGYERQFAELLRKEDHHGTSSPPPPTTAVSGHERPPPPVPGAGVAGVAHIPDPASGV